MAIKPEKIAPARAAPAKHVTPTADAPEPVVAAVTEQTVPAATEGAPVGTPVGAETPAAPTPDAQPEPTSDAASDPVDEAAAESVVPEPPAPYSQELIDALPPVEESIRGDSGLAFVETVPDVVMPIENVEFSTTGSSSGASDPVAEAEATVINDDLAASLIPMSHPDNGSCDLYEKDADGNILVPASEAATMLDHGFVVVATKAK